MAIESDAPAHRRRVIKESEKRALVARHAESGKSIMVSFCRDEGITLSSFQNWRKKFAAKPLFVEVSAPMLPAAVELVLVSGDRIVTSSGCDPL